VTRAVRPSKRSDVMSMDRVAWKRAQKNTCVHPRNYAYGLLGQSPTWKATQSAPDEANPDWLMPNYSCQTCTVLLVALNAATSSDSVRFMTPSD
jgi:hypothetical protein